MITQTKEQQAVALAEKHDAPAGFIADLRLNRLIVEWFFNLLADHAQQVREAHTAELVANAGVMPEVHELGMDFEKGWDGVRCYGCKEEEVRESIAAMQVELGRAQSLNEMSLETIRALQDTNLALLGHVEESRARVAELERVLGSFTKSDYIKQQHPKRYAAAVAAMKKGGGV